MSKKPVENGKNEKDELANQVPNQNQNMFNVFQNRKECPAAPSKGHTAKLRTYAGLPPIQLN